MMRRVLCTILSLAATVTAAPARTVTNLLVSVITHPIVGATAPMPRVVFDDESVIIEADLSIVSIPDEVPSASKAAVANAARARRERDAVAQSESPAATAAATVPVANEPDSAERKAARKRWANLIRHIYEVDPLVCPRCGGTMKIIALITEPSVIRAIVDSVRRTPSTAGSRHPPPPARPAVDGVR